MENLNWKDSSSYDRGDKIRIPTSWRLELYDSQVIGVHRHINYHPDQWLLSSSLFDRKCIKLGEKDIEKAKKEAILKTIDMLISKQTVINLIIDQLETL